MGGPGHRRRGRDRRRTVRPDGRARTRARRLQDGGARGPGPRRGQGAYVLGHARRPRGGRQHHLRRLPAPVGTRRASRRRTRGPGPAARTPRRVHAGARRQAGLAQGVARLAAQSLPARAARNDAVAVRADADEPGKPAEVDRAVVRARQCAAGRVDAGLPARPGRHRRHHPAHLRHDSRRTA